MDFLKRQSIGNNIDLEETPMEFLIKKFKTEIRL